MEETTNRHLFLKALTVTAILMVGAGISIYFLTLDKTNNKYKDRQITSDDVSISTADLQDDFVSLQKETGSPQDGNINMSGEIQGSSLTSNAQDGTSPLNVYSSTLVKNLNADMVDGKHAKDFVANKEDRKSVG